ncbi:hypothetical protein BYT27DRAFT_7222737 [Phlegmacium glaucopus]|nr:hypothetical protein BYT27DRAFT_7222737 [Phlegmacium glaucopus]
MSPDTSTCPGCDKTFSVRGYESHLTQSQDPLCRAIYEELRMAHTLYERLQKLHSSDSDTEAQSFQGDTFGSPKDYASDTEDYASNTPSQDMDMPGPAEHPPTNSDNSEEEEEDTAKLGHTWEPLCEGAPAEGIEEEVDNNDNQEEFQEDSDIGARRAAERIIIGEGHGVKPAMVVRYRDKYPSSAAGGVLAHGETGDKNYCAAVSGQDKSPWAPFNSRKDWEVALWAKLQGPGSTAFSDLLAIPGLRDALGLSYKNSDELNKIIDNKLPGRPQFKRHEVVQSGETFEFYSRNILKCLEALWGDPDFVDDLITERHYADGDMTWWWTTQVQTETRRKNITIVPIIISSDKTQLTTFRGKQAYPVYLTIGNLPKHIHRKPSRQGQVLLGYLPTSKLDHITNKASRRRCLSNLFHHCMQYIVKPLERAGKDGIVLTSGDGATRRCFPILAAYVGNYPEQILVGLIKKGECPICPAPHNEIGSWESVLKPRDTDKVIEALNSIDKGASEFTKACTSAGIKPVQCVFWKNLPFHDQISHFLLSLVTDIHLPDGQSNARLVRTVRAVLDFIYLARYPIHTSETLAQMDDALQAFHDNRDIFISLGIRTHFNIPKLHNIGHYLELIELFGTADNFNTEQHPTHCAVPLDDIHNKYSTMHFILALSRFIAQYQNPEYSKAQVETASHSTHIPFHKLSVFHHVKFVSYDIYALNPLDEVVVDSIHINPVHLDKYWKVVPGRFNTAIINIAPDNDSVFHQQPLDSGSQVDFRTSTSRSKYQVIQDFSFGYSWRTV